MTDTEKRTYFPSEMAEEIRGIRKKLNEISEIGGIDSAEHTVNFYDYDGSLLYSYSQEGFLSLAEMPPNPSHEGLIAQGWNWKLSEAKAYVSNHGALTIGQMYTTYDGKTRIYLRFDRDVHDYNASRRSGDGTHSGDLGFFDFYLNLSFSYFDDGEVHSWPHVQKCATIDWGDGSPSEDIMLNGDPLMSEGYDAYEEKEFRYSHTFRCPSGYFNSHFYIDFVVTIDVLHEWWRGRLGFSLNSFESEPSSRPVIIAGHHDWETVGIRADSPQLIQKIELGNNMDFGDHPDLLRVGSYYDIYWKSDNTIGQSASFSGSSVFSFSKSDIPRNTGTYLFVEVCVMKLDHSTFRYKELGFTLDDLTITPNVHYKKSFSLEPLSDWSQLDPAYFGPTEYVDAGFRGYVSDSRSIRIFGDGKIGYTNMIFELTEELPDTIEIIIEGPFSCEMACSVACIPKTTIPYTWDNYLYNLETVTLPKDLKSLSTACFKNCYKLKYITIPSGLTEIPDSVFGSAGSLEHLSLPNGITDIGIRAFDGCSRLTDLPIPDTVVSVGAGAFANCDGLHSQSDFSGMVQGISYQDSQEEYVVSDDIFNGCSDLTEVLIPSTIKKIADRAFKNCSSLRTVNVPSSLEVIGDEAFLGCTALIGGDGAFFADEFSYGYLNSAESSLRSIGQRAFMGCRGLTRIIFPSRVSTIPDSVCEDCQSLAAISLGTVGRIGNRAFYQCRNLLSVAIPQVVTEIGDYAFSGCRWASFYVREGSSFGVGLPQYLRYLGERAFEQTSIREVDIPYAITEIKEGTFSECTQLDSVTFLHDAQHYEVFHETVFRLKKIGAYAFYSTRITRISIPDSVTEIGPYAFAECFDLANVTLPSNLEAIEDHLLESTFITSIQIPSTVTRIGDYAFSGCLALSSVTIPSQVKVIGEGAFMSCSVSAITIPISVTQIGDYAFGSAYELVSITFKSVVPPIVEGDSTWCGLPLSCIIHVPQKHLEVYKSAPHYPDPEIYTYVADQPDDSVSVSGTSLRLSGQSVNMADTSLDIINDFAVVDGDSLIFN